MSLAAGNLAPVGAGGTSAPGALLELCECLHEAFAGGVVWKGHLPFLTEIYLDKLRRESELVQLSAARNQFCWLSFPGPVAKGLVSGSDFAQFVAEKAGQCKPSLTMYTYYLTHGDRLDYHLDQPGSLLSAILMLRHVRPIASRPSRLLYLSATGSEQEIALTDGEIVLFHGASVFHGREAISQGEEVRLLVTTFVSL